MILQDLLNQYIPSPIEAPGSILQSFLEVNANLVARLGEEVSDEEAKVIAQSALNFLGIGSANTPHVTNVAPENLPAAEPVWAPAATPPPAEPIPGTTFEAFDNATLLGDPLSGVVLGEEEDKLQKIAQLSAELAALKATDASGQVG